MVKVRSSPYTGRMTSRPHYASLEILLVEDNQTFADAERAFLSKVNGVTIVGHARNGPEAIAKTQQFHPHLVLLDIGLGVMSGFDVARSLLDLDRPPLVIFVSMHDGDAYRRKAQKLGANGFISKSNFATDLFPLIDQLIEQRLLH